MGECTTLDEEILDCFNRRGIAVWMTVSFTAGKGVWHIEEVK